MPEHQKDALHCYVRNDVTQHSQKASTRVSWSEADVYLLKECIQARMRIKTIATKLSRTPTAINKALDRFNIRPRKLPVFRRPKLSLKPARNYVKEKAQDAKDLPVSVPLSTALTWYENITGTRLVLIARHAKNPALHLFFTGDMQLHGYQVVKEINIERRKCSLPIFHVLGITEF